MFGTCPWGLVHFLELVFKCELEETWVVICTGRSDLAERAALHGIRVIGARRHLQAVVRIGEVSHIRDIEGLGAKLQRRFPINGERLEDREIHVTEMRSVERVLARSTDLAC